MGQNVYGLPKGIATALNEIKRNTAGRGKKKYRTEEDYYNAMVLKGSVHGFGKIDPLRKRLYNRAADRYKKDHPRVYQLATTDDMYNFLVEHGFHGIGTLYNRVGKDPVRQQMAIEAEQKYRNMRIAKS